MGKRTLGLRAVVLVALAAIGLLAGASLMRPAPQSAEATSLTEIKKLLASDAQAGDQFGGRVTVSGDTAVVGASQEGEAGDKAGAAYIFQRDEGGAGNWGEVKKLIASDAQANDRFGSSVAVSGDTVIVGASREDAGGLSAGAAYIFRRDEGGADNWGEVKKLTASDAQHSDFFGVSVAITGDTVIVGAYFEDAGGSDAGAAYVFERNQGGADNWGEVKKLTASDAKSGDLFGNNIAISGDTAFVGAAGDDVIAEEDTKIINAGAAYVFERSQGGANNWGEVKKLTASDAQADDQFGNDIAISGDTAFVGAAREDTGGSNAGAAYVFERDQGGTDNWGEVTKIFASDAQTGDQFGYSVAVSGDSAVVGAAFEDVAGFGSNAGSAYVFQRDQGGTDNWGELNKITASDAQGSDLFGVSVAVSGDDAVVGAFWEDARGVDAGASYVFDLVLLPKPTPTITPPPPGHPEMSLSVTNTFLCPGGHQAGKVCVGEDLLFDVVVNADEIPETNGYMFAGAWINYGDDLGNQATSGEPKAITALWPDCPGSFFFLTASSDTGGNPNDDAAAAACASFDPGPQPSFYIGPLYSWTLTCTSGSSSHLVTLEAAGGPNADSFGARFAEFGTEASLVPAHSGPPDYIVDSVTVSCMPILPEPADTDDDGCSDQRETGPDETQGGLRDFTNPYDFYDVLGPGAALPTDGVIDLPNDILGVLQHHPAGDLGYDAQFDRGPWIGSNSWNETQGPDGVIDLPNDILGVIMQFNHRCV